MQYLIGLGMIAFAGIPLFIAWREFKLWRLITNMTPTKAARVRPGLVEVEGKVGTAGELLVSPYTNKECVYYQFKIEEKQSNNSRHNRSTNSNWRTIVNDREAVNCLVEDTSGSVEVELDKAKFHLSTDFKSRSGTFSSAPADLEQMIQQRYGASNKGFIFNKDWRYTEKVLEPGDPIYVLGYAHEGDDGVIISTDGIEKTSKMPPLTVTDKGEGHVSLRYMGTTILLVGVGLFLIAFGVFLLLVKA